MHETRACGDDVGDRVERPDLVEVHLIDWHVVRHRLGSGQTFEHRRGRIPDVRSEICEQCQHVGKMADDRRLWCLDVHLDGAEGGPADPFGAQDDSQVERIDTRLEHLERNSRIEQRADQHVAAGAGAAVEPSDHRSPPTRPSMRTAAQAAPKPLSMLTTTTPCAQLASALFSAVDPPVATP
jgi:hypothetical protein